MQTPPAQEEQDRPDSQELSNAAPSPTPQEQAEQQRRQRRRQPESQEGQGTSQQHQREEVSEPQRPSTLLLLEDAARAVTTRALAPYYSTTLGFLGPQEQRQGGDGHNSSVHIHAERHVDEFEQAVRNMVRFVRHTVIPAVRILVQIQVIGAILLILSTITYAILYILIMPSAHWHQPIYFDYTTPAATASMGKGSPPLQQVGPSATVELLSLHTQWNPVQPDVVPEPSLIGTTFRSKSFSSSSRRLLLSRNRYFMEISLVLPDSEWNRNRVGIFMLHVHLYSSSQRETQPRNGREKETSLLVKYQHQQKDEENCDLDDNAPNRDSRNSDDADNITTPKKDRHDASRGGYTEEEEVEEEEEKELPHPILLATSRRSAIFPHESFMVATIRKLLLLFPYTFGVMHEAKRIVIPIFDHYVESRRFPLTTIHVQVVPTTTTTFTTHCDQDNSQHPCYGDATLPKTSNAPHVIQGEVIIGKELNVLQRLMKTWFYTCAAIGIMGLSAYYGLLLWVVRWYLQRWKQRRQQQQQQQEEATGSAAAQEGTFPNQTPTAAQRQGVAFSAGNQNNVDNDDDNDDDDDMWEATEVRSDREEMPAESGNEQQQPQQDAELFSAEEVDEMYDNLEPELLDESESRGEAVTELNDRGSVPRSSVPTTEERE